MAQNPDEEDVGMIVIQPAESWIWNSKNTLVKTIKLHQMYNMNLAIFNVFYYLFHSVDLLIIN